MLNARKHLLHNSISDMKLINQFWLNPPTVQEVPNDLFVTIIYLYNNSVLTANKLYRLAQNSRFYPTYAWPKNILNRRVDSVNSFR